MKTSIKHIIFWTLIALIAGFCIVMNKSYNEKNEPLTIGVHVKGEVNAPGYYELPYGSRIKDAVKYAGGEKESANLGAVNLAMKLRDGEEIIIPKNSDGTAEEEKEKININTADLYQLCKIKGIGEKTASEIIEYRTKHGFFEKTEDIKKVKGIGEENFNKIKEEITV